MEKLTHQTFRISGMTCVNCQNRIQRKLYSIPGIVKASVSYQAGTAEITYAPDRISPAEITAAIEGLDYQVLRDRDRGQPDMGYLVSTLVIIVCGYVLLQRFGILNLLVPSQLADTNMSYGLLFVIGLITSVHCIAMCGGISLSQCVPREDSAVPAVLPAVLYHLGRVISYTVIGFLLGLVGAVLGGAGQVGGSTLFQGVVKLIAGALMVVMGCNLLGLFPWLRGLTVRPPEFLTGKLDAVRSGMARPLAVGLLNGLMPCGPLQSMQLVALASGSPFAGALSMLMFSLGTVPLMLGLGSLVSALGKRFARTVRYVGAILVAMLGLAMLSQGASLSGLLGQDTLLKLIVALCVLGAAASVPLPKKGLRPILLTAVVCVAVMALLHGPGTAGPADTSTARMEDGVQVVTSALSSGRYPTIAVQTGTPVRWIIDAPAGSINGCNYKMLLREYGIEYTFQEGENVIEFTPTAAGTVQYSCWMGMIQGSILVTDGEL